MKQLLYRIVPALVFGGLAVICFMSLADRPHEGGGGPPIIDLGPLFTAGFGLVAMVVAFGLLFRKAKPSSQPVTSSQPVPSPPELPVAKAMRGRGRMT